MYNRWHSWVPWNVIIKCCCILLWLSIRYICRILCSKVEAKCALQISCNGLGESAWATWPRASSCRDQKGTRLPRICRYIYACTGSPVHISTSGLPRERS
ncbi:hypothetical protein F4808DRAFT_189193 [Astrocystis sublimbata]|nr:hypothetical protein F4808DRAFT_189193 [Astrocystis sublimbata]